MCLEQVKRSASYLEQQFFLQFGFLQSEDFLIKADQQNQQEKPLTQLIFVQSQVSIQDQQKMEVELQQKRIPSKETKNSKVKKQSQKVNKSMYHNFQKHAIVTLKHLVSTLNLDKQSDIDQLARKIWKTFLEGNGRSKQMFIVLYGQFNQGDQSLIKLFNKYGFAEILNFSPSQIRKAQNILREITIQQVTKEKVTRNLKLRKMSRKQQFELYMEKMIQQLSQGPIQRRLAKQKVIQIEKFFNSNKNIPAHDQVIVNSAFFPVQNMAN